MPFQEDESALVVWALWRHYYRYRDIEFIRPLWVDVVQKAADFMCRYRDPRTGLPLPSYDLWEERFESIKEAERHWARNGAIILKFFLNVSQEEQHQRGAHRGQLPPHPPEQLARGQLAGLAGGGGRGRRPPGGGAAPPPTPTRGPGPGGRSPASPDRR